MVSNERELSMLRYGSADPLPERRLLKAGPLTAVLEEGGLRYIRYRGQEIVRGIYAAVRDRNWGTIKPVFREFDVSSGEHSFEVWFVAEHRQGGIDFVWEGRITGSEEGTIAFTFDGEARSAFLRNRIGFCVLHPSDLAGRKVEVETAGGVLAGSFPDRISPHQPFMDMEAIRHELTPELACELRFSGDLFEMEDQRNWTDASFKTYCTPLRLPYPVEIAEGQRVRQGVTLTLLGKHADEGDAAAAGAGDELAIELHDRAVGRVPELGLGAAPRSRLSDAELAELRLLELTFLRAIVRLSDPDWKQELANAAAAAAVLGARLELEAVVPVVGTQQELLELLVKAVTEVEPLVDTVFLFPSEGYVSSGELSAALIRLRDAAGLSFRVGGGTRAYFAELNRAVLPLAELEAAMYTINPQVHAFDIASIAETASAQGDTVRSARAVVPGLPLSVGPITFKPRLNPNATSEEGRRRSEDRANHTDARQRSLFGAGWLLGSLRSLSEAGAERACYLETVGPLGARDSGDNGVLYPLYHVLAAAGKLQGAEVLDCRVSDRLSFDAMAIRGRDGKLSLLAANYTNETIRVRVRSPFFQPSRLRLLDERSAPMLAHAEYPAPPWQDGSFELELLPYAVAVVS
ncbi:hypothetical protein [Paenibacillus montanisoli]|uniref:Uncharacterized protein n=1 Tax=Paenibacillus montanisoli TaxID=2081970 RepID=A0A328U3P6_9BACL|nr:hypothetical protein [Paenibacillus montanisoli]RAP77418.1 hypothetical protein DL346_02750 [Paenibacillus montanisoli]